MGKLHWILQPVLTTFVWEAMSKNKTSPIPAHKENSLFQKTLRCKRQLCCRVFHPVSEDLKQNQKWKNLIMVRTGPENVFNSIKQITSLPVVPGQLTRALSWVRWRFCSKSVLSSDDEQLENPTGASTRGFVWSHAISDGPVQAYAASSSAKLPSNNNCESRTLVVHKFRDENLQA